MNGRKCISFDTMYFTNHPLYFTFLLNFHFYFVRLNSSLAALVLSCLFTVGHNFFALFYFTVVSLFIFRFRRMAMEAIIVVFVRILFSTVVCLRCFSFATFFLQSHLTSFLSPIYLFVCMCVVCAFIVFSLFHILLIFFLAFSFSLA